MSGEGMSDFITSATTALAPANLWGQVAAAGGLIFLVVLFAFGYRIVKKALKGVQGGKLKM